MPRTRDRHHGAVRASFVAFDLLQIDGQDLRKQTLEARRARLEPLVADANAILFSGPIEAEGALVFAKACEMGLEPRSLSHRAMTHSAASR